jgi:hypothetical protein
MTEATHASLLDTGQNCREGTCGKIYKIIVQSIKEEILL